MVDEEGKRSVFCAFCCLTRASIYKGNIVVADENKLLTEKEKMAKD